MPYAHNQGVRIHYEVEGEGPLLVLQHGVGASLRVWRDYGYVEGLKNDYRLILIDARGHGASDKPHNIEAYTSQARVGDILAVLDDLTLSKAHYCGYSMGGWIGFALAKYAPERFHSLMIGGMHPYNRDPEPLNQRVELLRKGMEAYVATMEASAGPLPPHVRALALANDAEALIAATLAVRDDPGFAEVLPTMTMPCLVYSGEADAAYSSAKEAVQHIPNATLVSLPALNHMEAFIRSEVVLPHITKFLATVAQERGALA
jgi:pimeloyl-ACP methyl ester carboxylesterase